MTIRCAGGSRKCWWVRQNLSALVRRNLLVWLVSSGSWRWTPVTAELWSQTQLRGLWGLPANISVRCPWSQRVAELRRTETQQCSKLKRVPGWLKMLLMMVKTCTRTGEGCCVYWGGSTGKNMPGSIFPFKWEKQKSINLAAL